MPINRTQAWLTLHRWPALVVSLLLFVQAASGTALVFRDEIEPLIHPALAVAPLPSQVPVQALIDRVSAAHPGARLSRLTFPARADRAVIFTLASADGAELMTAIDPYRNRIVRDGGLGAWPMEWLFNLHQQLLAGPVGETIVGCEGLVLIWMAITGLGSWWPGLRRLRQGFRVRLGGSAELRWRSLHRAVGAGAALLLILSAGTGAMMVWKPTVRAMLHGRDRPAPKVAARPGHPLVPADVLIARAERADGPAAVRQLRFSSGGRVIAVFLDSHHTIRADGTAQLYYDAYDGTERGRYIAGDLPAGSEFVDWLYTVHSGIWGGLVTRAILLFTGIALIGLALTGPWLFYIRTVRRRRRPRAIPE